MFTFDPFSINFIIKYNLKFLTASKKFIKCRNIYSLCVRFRIIIV